MKKRVMVFLVARQADKTPDHGATIREIFGRIAAAKPILYSDERARLMQFLDSAAGAMMTDPRLATHDNIDALANVVIASNDNIVRLHAVDQMGAIGKKYLDTKIGHIPDMEDKLLAVHNTIADGQDGIIGLRIRQVISGIRAERLDNIARLTDTLPKPGPG